MDINLTKLHLLAIAFDSFGEEGFGNAEFKLAADTKVSFTREKYIPARQVFVNNMRINCSKTVILKIQFESSCTKEELHNLLCEEIKRHASLYHHKYMTVANISILI